MMVKRAITNVCLFFLFPEIDGGNDSKNFFFFYGSCTLKREKCLREKKQKNIRYRRGWSYGEMGGQKMRAERE